MAMSQSQYGEDDEEGVDEDSCHGGGSEAGISRTSTATGAYSSIDYSQTYESECIRSPFNRKIQQYFFVTGI